MVRTENRETMWGLQSLPFDSAQGDLMRTIKTVQFVLHPKDKVLPVMDELN